MIVSLSGLAFFSGPVSLEAHAQAAERLQVTFPVFVNDRVQGNVLAEIEVGGEPLVVPRDLFALLSQSMNQTAISAISGRLGTDERIPVSQFAEAGLDIEYDSGGLRLIVRVPELQAITNAFSLASNNFPDPGQFARPEKLSAAITASLLTDYTHQSPFGDTGFEPVDAVLTGFVNIGGFEGGNLAFDVTVSDDGTVERNSVQLFKDDYKKAVRYAVGDIDPLVTGFQSSPGIGGISVSRIFGEIQPFRDVRPTGSQELFLERESNVEVVVNGVTVRTLNLQPGRYELRDFPFLDTSNDVEFFVQDDLGRRQVGRLSLFNTDALLAKGTSVFSANLGFVSETAETSETYDGKLVFTGFYERGLTPYLTLGANIQAAHDEATAGVRAAVSTGLGQVVTDAAFGTNEQGETGYAVGGSYRGGFNYGDRQTVTIDITGSTFSENFTSLNAGLAGQPRKWEVAGRVTMLLPAATNLTLGARWSEGRGQFPSERNFDLGVTKLFRRITLFTSFGYDDIDKDLTGRIGINVRFGQRTSVRTRYDSRLETLAVEAERLPRLEVGDISGRIGYEQRQEEDSFLGSTQYRSNRFEVEARHDFSELRNVPGSTAQSTSVRFTTGLAYTPGSLAIGRRTDLGFAIVKPHRTLRGQRIDVGANYAQGAVARVDRFGGIAVPILQPYVPQAFEIEARNLPTGYDIGSGRFEILPGAASGYSFTVGSDASYTLVGTLLLDGEQLTLLSGMLVPEDGGDALPFFTNRAGRFVVERVSPGRYSLKANGIDGSAMLEIKSEDDPYVDIGQIELGRFDTCNKLGVCREF